MSATSVYKKYKPWHDFQGKRVLNAGCGFAKYPAKNVVNLDAFDICKPDVVHDLNKTPLPFEDETFDLIIANHIMEHISNWWECFNEFARILKPNGYCEIWIPESGSDSAVGFRDHVVVINHCSFYGTFGTYRAAGNAWAIENAKSPANRLKLVNNYTNIVNKWWTRHAPHSVRLWMAEHLRNVAYERGYEFRKVTVAEHEKEMEKFNERKASSQTLSVF